MQLSDTTKHITDLQLAIHADRKAYQQAIACRDVEGATIILKHVQLLQDDLLELMKGKGE